MSKIIDLFNDEEFLEMLIVLGIGALVILILLDRIPEPSRIVAVLTSVTTSVAICLAVILFRICRFQLRRLVNSRIVSPILKIAALILFVWPRAKLTKLIEKLDDYLRYQASSLEFALTGKKKKKRLAGEETEESAAEDTREQSNISLHQSKGS